MWSSLDYHLETVSSPPWNLEDYPPGQGGLDPFPASPGHATEPV